MMENQHLLRASEMPVALLAAQPTRLEIQNILCATDFSECSRNAFRYALRLSRYFQAQLFLQHTVSLSAAAFMEGGNGQAMRQALEAARQDARRKMRSFITDGGATPSEVTMVLNDGDIREQLLQSISKEKIDLVIIGTHGRKGVNRLLLGSVAEHVIHESIAPVLVVSQPVADFGPAEFGRPVELRTILLSTDFSPNAGRALTYALRWASEWGGKVILFHAVEKVPSEMKDIVDLFPEYNPYFEKQVAESWGRIRQLVPNELKQRCEVVYEIRHGNPKEEILKVAGEKHADMIVMGARGLGRSAIAWGSTVSGVVRDGRFPVLAIRHLVE
ncbi:MAG: hypothetical protein A3F68_01970 [Acidobacteria bacterium RIFCSPLOWO2_12_FULL_54_10]|nr:MAG: hypothetical protein A3F68_01970 [Acidobacteria bacterium RIFCSPLOWO2_12_FULL_54_10]